MRGEIALVDVGIARGDIEPAAIRHGIAGVDRKIHDDLMQLMSVRHDLSRERVEAGGQGNVLADQAVQHAHRIVDDGVHLQRAGLNHLLAAECQQLAGEADGMGSGLADLVSVRMQRVVGRQRFEDQVAIPVDDGEQVVEVVRHTSGEPADAFEFLRLSELALQVHPLRDVDRGSDGTLLAVDFDELRGKQARALLAVLPAKTALPVADRAFLACSCATALSRRRGSVHNGSSAQVCPTISSRR